MAEQTFDFDQYVEQHDLNQTDHERVWWATESPHPQAFDAAEAIADEFPGLTVVGTESRVQMSDVKWNLNPDAGLVVLGFYPIRADHHTDKVIEDIRGAL